MRRESGDSDMRRIRKHSGQLGCILILFVLIGIYAAVRERMNQIPAAVCLTPFLSDRIRGYILEHRTHEPITNAEVTVLNTTPRISDCYDDWESARGMPLLDEGRLFTDGRGYFESHIN